MPYKYVVKAADVLWARGLIFFLKIICGISYEVRGKENIPDTPVIYASKHQSAWETITFFNIIKNPVFILKKELIFVPFIGQYIIALRSIFIDRSSGAKALKKMLRDSASAIKHGRSIVIFPEGTRTKPGAEPKYHSGVAAIYGSLNVRVVPIALNSGLFWARKSFYKKPGKVIVEFLPSIEPGLGRAEFMKRLQDSIENKTTELINESKNKI